MQRSAQLSVGEYYHVYNRGNDKQRIFKDKADHYRFILLLYYANSADPVHLQNVKKELRKHQGLTLMKPDSKGENLVDIIAWCLMPNHFHILIREKQEGGISKFLSKLSTGYTMYYNKRYERVGSLLQGAFKSEHVSTDKYLKYLFSYIHLNPIKLYQSDWKEKGINNLSRARDFLNKYEYSSYPDYFGGERWPVYILEKKAFPDYFETSELLHSDLLEWLDYKA